MKQDKAWVAVMQELRRSNAAMPVASGKKYKRRSRSAKRAHTE